MKYDFYEDIHKQIVGIDEVGRGSWSGPVVACSVLLEKKILHSNAINQIRDSKLLVKNTRANLSSILKKNSKFSFGSSSASEIDKIGILKATELAMKRSFNIFREFKCKVKVDGPRFFSLNENTEFMVKGELKSIAIASASILAKVFRDNLMIGLSKKYPFYGWDRNSGYGTKLHKQCIDKFGVSDEHRMSFAPMKFLKNFK